MNYYNNKGIEKIYSKNPFYAFKPMKYYTYHIRFMPSTSFLTSSTTPNSSVSFDIIS